MVSGAGGPPVRAGGADLPHVLIAAAGVQDSVGSSLRAMPPAPSVHNAVATRSVP